MTTTFHSTDTVWWNIHNRTSGQWMGLYRAETQDKALMDMIRDAGADDIKKPGDWTAERFTWHPPGEEMGACMLAGKGEHFYCESPEVFSDALWRVDGEAEQLEWEY